jgi:hypothetical protein
MLVQQFFYFTGSNVYPFFLARLLIGCTLVMAMILFDYGIAIEFCHSKDNYSISCSYQFFTAIAKIPIFRIHPSTKYYLQITKSSPHENSRTKSLTWT